MNSFSSSITWTPCSKFAEPFWPMEAICPLTAICSGAVADLRDMDGRWEDNFVGSRGDPGGDFDKCAIVTSSGDGAYSILGITAKE